MTVLDLTSAQWLDAGISLGIVVLTVILGRRLVRLVLDGILVRLTGLTKTGLDNLILDSLRPVLYILGLVAVFQYSIRRLDYIEQTKALGDIFFSMYFLVGFLFIWLLVGRLFQWYSREVAPQTDSRLDEQVIPFFRRIALILIGVIGVIILLDHFNVDVSALVTTLGIGSLAIALAAQETLADMISGFVIMVDRPFRIGDRIEIQSLATWGDVVDIGLRSSRIRTLDNRMVIVPNSVIGKSLVVNHAYPDTFYRIQIQLGVAYGTDLDHARSTIIGAVQTVEGVSNEHPVEALFLEFGDSGLIFRVRWWIESYIDTRRMFDQVNSEIYRALNNAGIVIPFPQRDIHLYDRPGHIIANAGID